MLQIVPDISYDILRNAPFRLVVLKSKGHFLGRFRIFENGPLDPVLSLRVISESKYVKQKFEKIV